MQWTDEATELFAQLIASLPSSLRTRVDEKAEDCAEVLALQRGSKEVVSAHAFHAVLECTPVHLRARLVEVVNCESEKKNPCKEEVKRRTLGVS